MIHAVTRLRARLSITATPTTASPSCRRDRGLRARGPRPRVRRVHPRLDHRPPARRRPGGHRRGRRLRRARPHRPPRRRPGPRPQRPGTLGRALRAARRARPLRAARRRSATPRATTGAGRTRAPRSTWRCARAAPRCTRRSGATRSRSPSSARPGSRSFGEDEPARAPSRSASGSRSTRRCEFKLDPENDWDAELIAELARDRRPCDVLDLKGLYRGTPVDVETDPELYARRRRGVPRRLPRGPRPERRDPRGARAHDDRITWDATLHSLADIEADGAEGDQLQAVALRLAAGAARRSTSTARRTGSPIYGGGQGESGVGRGQIQYLASLFHPDTPNDVAPSGYNDPAVPDGLPTSPLDPAPSRDRLSLGRVGGRTAIGPSASVARNRPTTEETRCREVLRRQPSTSRSPTSSAPRSSTSAPPSTTTPRPCPGSPPSSTARRSRSETTR